MNISMTTRALLASAALGVAAGCSGGSQIAATPAAPASQAAASSTVTRAAGGGAFIEGSGRFLRTGHHARYEAPQSLARRYTKGPKDLFVALLSDVAIFSNKRWNQVGTIDSTAMACPDGDWIDKKGNLYVADWDCGGSNTPGVYEFKPGASTPSFVYTAGLNDPINVETDNHGNVYVMDFGGGYLDEYKQGSNTVLHQCSPPSGYGLVESAAIDSNGNVFMVSVDNQAPWTAYLYEYAGGLKGCPATQLATFPFFPGGLVLDKNANIILVDQVDGVVDILPPPYTAIGSQISVPSGEPFMATINKKNDQIYVTGYATDSGGSGAVYIDAYPSGSNLATLGASDGIPPVPGGVVDTLNYVP